MSSARWQGWGAFACAVATVAAVACGGHTTPADGSPSSQSTTGVASEAVGGSLAVTSDALVGPLAPNMPLAITYHAPPTYRAFEVDLATSATVDAWVVPTSGTALAFLTDGSFTVLATTSDATAGTSAHIASTGALDAGKYFVVMREASEQDTTFNVSWTTLDATAGIMCAGSIAGVPYTESNVHVSRTQTGSNNYSLSVDSYLLARLYNQIGDTMVFTSNNPLLFTDQYFGSFSIAGTTVTADGHGMRSPAPNTIVVTCSGTGTLTDGNGNVLDGGTPPPPHDAGISSDSSTGEDSGAGTGTDSGATDATVGDAGSSDDASDDASSSDDGSADAGADASTCIATPNVNPTQRGDLRNPVVLGKGAFGVYVAVTPTVYVAQFTQATEITQWISDGEWPDDPMFLIRSGCDMSAVSGPPSLSANGTATTLLSPGFYLLVYGADSGVIPYVHFYAEPAPTTPDTNTSCATASGKTIGTARVYDTSPRYFKFTNDSGGYVDISNGPPPGQTMMNGLLHVEIQTTCDLASSDILNTDIFYGSSNGNITVENGVAPMKTYYVKFTSISPGFYPSFFLH